MDDGQNTWQEWSKHVLKELERLNHSYERMTCEIQLIREDKQVIAELKAWKNIVQEEMSVHDFAKLKQDVEKLKSFKTTAVTVWLVVQAAISISILFISVKWR